ncbi:MAG: hypothetical protein ACWGHH_05860 [Sulfurovaceae bacterium]
MIHIIMTDTITEVKEMSYTEMVFKTVVAPKEVSGEKIPINITIVIAIETDGMPDIDNADLVLITPITIMKVIRMDAGLVNIEV